MRTTSPPPTPSTRRFWRQRKATMTVTAGLTASTNASSSKLHQIPSMTQVWQALPIRMFWLYVYWVWGFENFFSVPLRFSHHVRPMSPTPFLIRCLGNVRTQNWLLQSDQNIHNGLHYHLFVVYYGQSFSGPEKIVSSHPRHPTCISILFVTTSGWLNGL